MLALPEEIKDHAIDLDISPEAAVHILAECAYPHQRPIRQYWVDELTAVLRAHEWAKTTITITQCRQDGRQYLVDGYHRLNSIVKANMNARLVMSYVPTNTLKDVGVLYSRLDRGLPRSMRDGLIAREMPSQTEITVGTLQKGVAAVSVIEAGFRAVSGTKRSYDARFHSVEGYTEELRRYQIAIEKGPASIRRKLLTSPILAVGLTLMRHQPDKAYRFFNDVACAAGLEKESGQHTMLSKVLDDEERKTRKASIAVMCRFTAFCWNAFYEDRKIPYVRVYDPSKPLLLAGTPYNRTSYDK